MPISIPTSLLTDMYKFMVLDAALEDSTAYCRCTFELFGCRLLVTRRFGVVIGTGRILEALKRFEFDAKQIDWLHDQGITSEEAAQFPTSWRFTGDIWGYTEDECYSLGSPLLIVEGMFANCTLLETSLLSILNYDCAVAPAASRITIAVYGCPCMDMGTRRARECAMVSTARVVIIDGFQSASGLEAAKRYDIRCIGTAAHALTLLYDAKRNASDSQVARLGTGTTLLVDTHDVRQGAINTVEAACAADDELGAVCPGSDDPVAETLKARGQLDMMGTTATKIMVTSDLDEYVIATLGAAPADSYGVGIKFVTGSDVLTATLVYKIAQREDGNGQIVFTAKKAESKPTIGGRKVTGHVMGKDGCATEELLSVSMSFEEGQALLAERDACPLQVQLVCSSQIDTEAWGPEALSRAQEHHLRVRNESSYQAWRLSEGEVAIPTCYEQVD